MQHFQRNGITAGQDGLTDVHYEWAEWIEGGQLKSLVNEEWVCAIVFAASLGVEAREWVV